MDRIRSGRFHTGVVFPSTKAGQESQPDNIATPHRPSQEERQLGSATEKGSQKMPLPQNNGLRTRLAQLFNTQKVPHPPAERFEGNWENEVSEKICERWITTQKEHNVSTVSLVALSKIKALEYERKNLESIPEDQRLLPPSSKKHDYYDAEIKAFLEAVGEKDPDSVLESFKRVGTGGLHRQHVVASATAAGAVGAASTLASAPVAKAILSGIRWILLSITTNRILNSGWRRLRNAGTEDMLPLGRADAAPSAKQAPNVFQASAAILRELKGVEKNLRRMETALGGLIKAQDVYDAKPNIENKHALDNAKSNLEMTYAKACYQMSVKAGYKAASESAKIEFRGNQINFITSYIGSGATVLTGLLSVFPTTVIPAAATGGASLGAIAVAALLYIGYQLSTGPKKDGEAKAKRAIVALSKSIDILSADNIASQQKRAKAYHAYTKERIASRFSPPATRAKVKKEAEEKLRKRLKEITQEEMGKKEPMSLRKNRDAYRDHIKAVSVIEAARDAEDKSPDEASEEIKALEDAFQKAHQADFNAKTIADGWKTPMRMRMDSAGRLLKGKVAQSHKRLIKLHKHLSQSREDDSLSLKKKIEKESEIGKLKRELAKNLLDMFNLELALKHMQSLIDGKDTNPEAMAHAAAAMAAIQDKDVRSLFCGDARAQVEAVNLSKKLTFGEAERYTYTNAGSSAIAIGLNLGVASVDLGFNAAIAADSVVVGFDKPNPEGKVRLPKFRDYKLIALPLIGVQPAVHLAAGDRAPFQKREMQELFKVTENKGDAVESKADLTDGSYSHLRKDDEKVAAGIEALVDQLWNMNTVPEKITLSMKKPQTPSHEDSPASLPASAEHDNISLSVDMKTASAYHRARVENAPLDKKIKSTATKIGIGARQAAMSIAGLPTQWIAQIPLKNTRASFKRYAELGPEIRESLAQSENSLMEKDAAQLSDLSKRMMEKIPAPVSHGRASKAPTLETIQKEMETPVSEDLQLEAQIAHGFVKGKESLWREAMLKKMKREEMTPQMQLNSSPSREKTGKDLRAIKKALDIRESNYPNWVRLQQGISTLKSKFKYKLDKNAKLMTQLKPKELDELMIGRHTAHDGTKVGSGLTGLLNPATKEREKREELVEKINEKLKPSEKLETLSLQDLKKKRRGQTRRSG